MDVLGAELSRLMSGFDPLDPALRRKLILSLLIALFFWLLRSVVLRSVTRRTEDATLLYRWRKHSLYTAAAAVGVLLSVVWFEQVRSFATFLGLLSAGLAIALSGLVSSAAGWVFLLVRRPFEVGDRIQIGEHAGDVIDVRLFKFSLIEIGNWVDADQSTGRVIHVPNNKVLSDVIINYTRGFHYIWNEIAVLVTFESNWEKAKALLQEIADRHGREVVAEAERSLKEAARSFLIYYRQLAPTVYTSVKDSGVLLTIRHLTAPRRRRGMSQAIWEDVLRAFAAAPDIDLAYPTQRFYRHSDEGKPALRPPPADGG